MSDNAFQPISAAVRRISSDEGDLLRGFLSSDLTFDEFLSAQSIDPTAAQKVIDETGLTLPDRGLGDQFAATDLKLFTDILQGSESFFDASKTFGFDTTAALEGLEQSGLRIPLQPGNRSVFDLASDFGFTSTDVSRELGVDVNAIDTTLAAAGLSLPGKSFSTKKKNPSLATGSIGTGSIGTDPTRSSNVDLLSGAFSGVPQAPGVKLGFLRHRSTPNPNIKSGPRGVTQSGTIRRNKLTAGTV